MEQTSINISTLHDLLIHELSSLHNAAEMVLEVLPRMAQVASAPEVRHGFEEHISDTREQISRLDSIFSDLEANPTPSPCDGMTGIICEIDRVSNSQGPADIKDAALISSARKMEAYAVSGYSAARTYARVLELDHVLQRLQRTIDIENGTNQQLEEIIERSINVKASGA